MDHVSEVRRVAQSPGRRATGADRELAWQLLSQSVGSNPSAEELANAASDVFGRLAARVRNVIGDDGYAALLKRALYLARSECPDVPGGDYGATIENGWLETLQAIARDRGASPVARCVISVLAHLHWLLVTFLGANITGQLIVVVSPKTASSDTTPGEHDR